MYGSDGGRLQDAFAIAGPNGAKEIFMTAQVRVRHEKGILDP